ncbi:hypothetical protein [Wenzhouxiangella sp. EGI_FJ10409]|uniref:hypothetical protein n=1 Tax=Wenzhouxiangella sp. EGI_FJ10409 TaxID=3243767 RepID=UPI0035D6CA93
MKNSLLALILLNISGLASGISIEPSSLESAVYRADAIAHVRVTEGRALFFSRDEFGRVSPCMGIYKAEVLNLLKGEITESEFGINFNLMLTPGNEYLLFLDNKGGLGIEYSMFETADYQECIEGRPSVMARWRASSLVEWKLTDGSGWIQMATAPYGVFLELPRMTDEGKVVFEEYVARIQSIISDQAKNGFSRNDGVE